MRLLLLSSALAGLPEPVVQVLDDGTIHAEALVDATAERVREVLRGPMDLHRIGREVEVEETQPDGDCTLVSALKAHPLATVRYLTRACPTEDGYAETLVASDDLQDFRARLQVVPEGDQARIVYDVRAEMRIPAPEFVVNRESRMETERLMHKVQSYFED